MVRVGDVQKGAANMHGLGRDSNSAMRFAALGAEVAKN
jgi:hypothetical protein